MLKIIAHFFIKKGLMSVCKDIDENEARKKINFQIFTYFLRKRALLPNSNRKAQAKNSEEGIR